jgi:tetratricopeptide (TPR) repeat protein
LAANGRYEEAAVVAKRALAVDSTSFAAKLLLAEAFSYGDSAKRACEIYYQLYNHASSHPRILKKLAACYLKDGQHQTALSFLKIYLAATGDSSVSVLADIGRIFHSISRFDSAAVYFALAVQRDSTVAIHHFNLGLAYYQLKKYRDAEKELRQAIALSQETLELISKEHYMLGAIYMNQNKNKSAIQAYRRSADLNPEYVEAYYFLGTVYRSLGDQTNAATWFRRFLQRAPKEKRYQDMRTDARQSLKGVNAVKKPN